MTRINLLPWREKRREEKKRQLFVLIAGSAIAMLLLIVIIHITLMTTFSRQNHNNLYLQGEVDKIDDQLKKIAGLQKEKSLLLARTRIIYELQAKRPQVVHLFDELVRILPEGVYLSNISRQESTIILIGKAESSTLVSTFMRNIEASESLTNPELKEIKNDPQSIPFSSVFTLKITQGK